MSDLVEGVDTAHSSHEESETRTPAAQPTAAGGVEIGTLARLLLGSALLGQKALTTALQAEDEQIAGEASTQGQGPSVARPVGVPDRERSARAQHALIGMVFDTGERAARRGEAVLGTAARTTRALVAPAVRWAGHSRLLSPARRRYEALAKRGQAQMERWVERGLAEEARSQALLETAVIQTVDTSLDHVVENPKVQELVEEQSTGLAQEMVEELRERAVSLDLLVERLVGRVLRRPPRRMLAPLVSVPVPRQRTAGAAPSLAGQPAGFVSRLVAFLIDVVVISVAFIITGWLLDAVQSVLGAGILLSPGPVTVPEFTYGGIHLSGTMLFWVGYLLIFWTASGKTLGKAILGLQVVTRDGRGLSLGRSLLRAVGYILSAIFFYLGFLWVALDSRHRGWHDSLARTYVVYCWNAHPEEQFLAEERQDLAPAGATDASGQGSLTT
jgi:uncharacterized RDD family membrane protein YckC